MASISCRHVKKVYPGNVVAVPDFSLEIADKEFIVFVGPSGCGKSTLLNIIGGLETPTEGKVLVDGAEVTGPGPDRGIVFQQYALFPWLTVEKNVQFGLKLQGKSKEEAEELAHKYLKMVDLEGFAKAYPKELSGGMKQRLLLASALLGDPKLLILDEPTAGLDPKERVRLRELLADMAKDRIILVATHVVSDVETVATKVILLRAGKIVDAAPVPELIEKYAPGQGLEDVYLNVFGEGDGK